MKISFIGLSCFMIENQAGLRILVDPFNAAPEWSLGPKFPEQFNNAPFGANIVLMTEPDADHAYAPGDWLYKAPKTKPNSNPFPNLNLRGTIVYEYNGDLNIAYSYTVDGIRCLHLGDNAHQLTTEQIKEIGPVDIVFMSAPKVISAAALEDVRQDIKNLDPKIIIWAHHIAPTDLPKTADSKTLEDYFRKYFKENASTNKTYSGGDDFIQLCYIYENALALQEEYNGLVPDGAVFEVTKEALAEYKKPTAILFKNMLAD